MSSYLKLSINITFIDLTWPTPRDLRASRLSRVGERQCHDQSLPVSISERPDACRDLTNLVNLLSRSPLRVWRMSPTGSGNNTRSTAWAKPCGTTMSFLSTEILAPLMVTILWSLARLSCMEYVLTLNCVPAKLTPVISSWRSSTLKDPGTTWCKSNPLNSRGFSRNLSSALSDPPSCDSSVLKALSVGMKIVYGPG